MTTASSFILPQGVRIAVGGNSLVIRHPGDVVLEQTLGRQLSSVEAGGDLTLRVPTAQGALQAGGILTAECPVDAHELRGTEVRLTRGPVRAKAIVASKRIVIGSIELAVDIVSAPEVIFAPDAKGRIQVLDTPSPTPPPGVRGCRTPSQWRNTDGDIAAYFARRSVEPLTLTAERSVSHSDASSANPMQRQYRRILRAYGDRQIPDAVFNLERVVDQGEPGRLAGVLDSTGAAIRRTHLQQNTRPPRGAIESLFRLREMAFAN